MSTIKKHTHSLDNSVNDNSTKVRNKVVPLDGELTLNSVPEFLNDWEEGFTDRMYIASGSKSRSFDFEDAVKCTMLINKPFDKLLIEYMRYISLNPLRDNDYFKYVDSYFKGKELDIKYFRHDKTKLAEYYDKVNKEQERASKEGEEPRNIFSRSKWESYVLFMMLKLNGLYTKQYDEMFNVKEDDNGNREYNPLTNLPSVLRQSLPFMIKEYDIKQANPTFLLLELGMEYFDVYERMGTDREKAKTQFNMLINYHKDAEVKIPIEEAREGLKKVFGERSKDVLTDERYNNKGKTYDDLTAYEKKYVEKFVKANDLTEYVRLHDSVVVPYLEDCEVLEFGIVTFKESVPEKPANENEIIPFYDPANRTTPARYSKFFIQEGFIRLSEQDKDEITIIKNENKIIKLFNHSTDTLNFLSNEINEFNTEPLENTISNDSHKIKSGFLLMEGEPLELHRDTKEEVYIPFKNGVAKVTKDEVIMVPYSDKNIGFFAEVETLKHDFNYSEDEGDQSVFKDFVTCAVLGRETPDNAEDLTSEEIDALLGFCSMIGYLVSNYKDPSNAFAVILSDEGANDYTRAGRRGKSLIQEGIKRVRVCNEKAGDSMKTDYLHKYADLKKEHDVYIVDDTPAGFNYNSFYSEIKTGISAERKGTQAEYIPFEMTPKFMLSTNYAVRYNKEDASTNDRFREYQFTDYWNINHKPDEVYNQTFFSDWNENEWNQFYCFIAECVQIFMERGLTQIEYDKDADNFRGSFNNDVILEEFERVFGLLDKVRGFKASDFLRFYQDQENPLRFEKYFHRNNVKDLINAYLKMNPENNLTYIERERKWIDEDPVPC